MWLRAADGLLCPKSSRHLTQARSGIEGRNALKDKERDLSRPFLQSVRLDFTITSPAGAPLRAVKCSPRLAASHPESAEAAEMAEVQTADVIEPGPRRCPKPASEGLLASPSIFSPMVCSVWLSQNGTPIKVFVSHMVNAFCPPFCFINHLEIDLSDLAPSKRTGARQPA